MLRLLLCTSALFVHMQMALKQTKQAIRGRPQGKCDRVSDNVQELYSDVKRIVLDDLVSLGAGLATDEINSLLSELLFVDLKLMKLPYLAYKNECCLVKP